MITRFRQSRATGLPGKQAAPIGTAAAAGLQAMSIEAPSSRDTKHCCRGRSRPGKHDMDSVEEVRVVVEDGTGAGAAPRTKSASS
jgi:hypothetical protein